MEEDAQKSLRSKILAIHADKSLTVQEKSRRVQALMNNRTSDVTSQTPQTNEQKNDTIEVTYFTGKGVSSDLVLGCSHYKRNCRIKAPCCKKIFTCRRCHDEQVEDHHKINRYDIQEMICMFCKQLQPVNSVCQNCEKSMASYYCDICKFFDDDISKGLWHCDKCGLCRVGGKENFFHCNECNMCLSNSVKQHKHTERAFETNCPVCSEWLLTSTNNGFQPKPCFHPIHSKCYKELGKHGKFSCPICSKTYSEFKPLLAPFWEELRQMKAESPMPDDYKDWRVEVLCNDCEKYSESPFHWVGTECSHCKGWNTKITKTIKPHSPSGNN
jgi:RING finger/CHY zinc finger protein 1